MKKIVYSSKAPEPIGPYSQGVIFGNLLFLSGQIAIEQATGSLIMSSVADETKQVMENIKFLLDESKTDFSKIVKTSIFLSSMEHFQEVNRVYASYFEGNYPARETVAVSGLPKGVNVEISVIVALN
jgi:2-iminobutanoate/2-iminopropanoate deaminase